MADSGQTKLGKTNKLEPATINPSKALQYLKVRRASSSSKLQTPATTTFKCLKTLISVLQMCLAEPCSNVSMEKNRNLLFAKWSPDNPVDKIWIRIRDCLSKAFPFPIVQCWSCADGCSRVPDALAVSRCRHRRIPERSRTLARNSLQANN